METTNTQNLKDYILNKKQLTNYAERFSTRDFLELFPKNEYNFENTTYKKYLYLGKEESVVILQDYFLLLNKAYNSNHFSYEHFYSVIKEFMENLEANNVYFCYKTYYGHKLLNNNIMGFVQECAKLLGVELTPVENAQLNEFEFQNLPLKDNYNFAFFDFLNRKLDGTLLCENYVLEPILVEDCKKIQKVYLQDEKVQNPPFYLDTNSKYYKYIRPRVGEHILNLLPKEKAWSVVDTSLKEVAFFVLSPNEDSTVTLNIISDCDYMDSKLCNAIEVVQKYAGSVMGASKIIGLNNSESIGYSSVATAYSLAKFVPNYDSAVGDNGLTRLNYSYNIAETDKLEITPKTPLKPLEYATFSVYKK